MKHLLILGLSLSVAASVMAQSSSKKTDRVKAPAAAPAQPVAPAPAEPAPAPEAPIVFEAPEVAIAHFFGSLQRKEVDAAYDQLTRGTKIAERPDDVKMLKSKTKEAVSAFGAIIGSEEIAKKTVGERLISYTYLSLGKEFPLRWRFYFYKAQDSWRLIDLRVDDRLGAIFDEPEAPASREP